MSSYQGPGASYRAGVAYGAIFGPYGSDPYAGTYGQGMVRPGANKDPNVQQPATTGTSTKLQDVARKVQTKCDGALNAAARGQKGLARSRVAEARGLASKAPVLGGGRAWLLEQVAACAAQVEQTLAGSPAPSGGADQGGFFNSGPVDMTETAPGSGEYIPADVEAGMTDERTGLPWYVVTGVGLLLAGAGLWAATGKDFKREVGLAAGKRANPRRRRSRRSRR